MHPRGNLSRGSGLHDNPHQGNETNQVETEAGEECPGAATGTSETWSKTSTHAVDTTRPGPLNADLRSVYGQGGLALFTHEARLSTCENECLSEKISGTCWYLHTLCCTIKLMVCRVAGMCVWWCACPGLSSKSVFIVTDTFTTQKNYLNVKNQLPTCIHCEIKTI